jgi:hypothetical protein
MNFQRAVQPYWEWFAFITVLYQQVLASLLAVSCVPSVPKALATGNRFSAGSIY